MRTNRQQYNAPTTSVVKINGGSMMLGMSDNGEATEIQAPQNPYMNWEEEEDLMDNELLR